jgi:predicted nicotinamide N-methyase
MHAPNPAKTAITAKRTEARRDGFESFVRSATLPMRAQLVPEILLGLAADPTGIFVAAERLPRPEPECYPPYWAFAWPGGQALARYILDHPQGFSGRRVVDIGAGSGLSSIAAAMAGADVLAADVDPVSLVAIGLNARANGVRVAVTQEDLLGRIPEADVIMIGDLVYEPALATRVAAFLAEAAKTGVRVILADRTTAKRPPLAFDLLAEYAAPVVPALPGNPFEAARVWALAGSRRRDQRRGNRP